MTLTMILISAEEGNAQMPSPVSPSAISLDQLLVEWENPETGKQRTIAALSPERKEKIKFISYHPPPAVLDRASVEELRDRLQYICKDLHTVLQLPHDKFWCQVVFDASLHKCIDSYLKTAPRSYDGLADLPTEVRALHQKVHHLVFLTCLRMTTHRESKYHFITADVFGDILYENFIFDVPKLVDLCILYGRDNAAILSKMITNVFTQQPKYTNDLTATVPTIFGVLDNILEKCGINSDPSSMSPQALASGSVDQQLASMEEGHMVDIVSYLVDIGSTLSVLLEIYPPACHVFHEMKAFQRLARFYDLLIPELTAVLKSRAFADPSTKTVMRNKLRMARKEILNVCHLILNNSCVQPVLDARSKTDVSDCVEDFLQTYTSIIGERRFLADFEAHYSLNDSLDIFTQIGCDVDETRLTFLRDATNTAFTTFGRRKQPKGAKHTGGRPSPEGSAELENGIMGAGASDSGPVAIETKGADPLIDALHDDYQVEAAANWTLGACATRVTGVELDSLISSVKDLIPVLGDGFIEVCLEEFGYNVELVINAVLEGKLPPSLEEIDRELERTKTVEEAPDTVLSERRNVYDYDDFDVFNRTDVDMSKIHIGKKGLAKDFLDDKTDLAALKPMYDYHGAYDTTLDLNEYEDEYDDTYDSFEVGAKDDDSADTMLSGRKFVMPRILEQANRKERVRSKYLPQQNSDDEDEAGGNKNFVRDPARLRELAEERRKVKAGGGPRWNRNMQQAQQVHSQGQRSDQTQGPDQTQKPDQSQGQGQGSSQGQGQKTYDVKGKPKGQGQDSSVLRNRNFKEKNKARTVNHNRRERADRKRVQ